MYGVVGYYVFFVLTVDQTWGQSPSKREEPAPPSVQISFPDIGDKDFQNDTMAIMTNLNIDFEMFCTAAYPLEWIFHYGPGDKGINEHAKAARTTRFAKKFEDVTSYTYTATLRIAYRGILHTLTNFTCQRAGVPPGMERTHVIMSSHQENLLIYLNISTAPPETPHYRTPSPFLDDNQCDHAVVFEYPPPPVGDKAAPCFKCEDPTTGNELELDFNECISPIQCESTLSPYRKGKTCLRNVSTIPENCKYVGDVTDFNPKIVLCKNFGFVLAQFYFFGLYRGDSLEDLLVPSPPIYYNWEEVNPSDMLYIHPLKEDRVYLEQVISLTCEYSHYYFSLGSWFGVYTEMDGLFEHIRAVETRPCIPGIEGSKTFNCSEADKWRGTYFAAVNYTVKQVGSHQVYCFGPVWNSTAWINASQSFFAHKGVSPKVTSLEAVGNPKFVMGQRDRELVCTYTGHPVPNVTWVQPNNETHYTVFRKDNYTSIIRFSEIGYNTEGTHICSIHSFMGSNTRNFTIHPVPEAPAPLSTAVIVIISLAAGLVGLTIFLVIWRMRRIIHMQRETLRLLTETEIDEFFLGNPDLLIAEQNDYFNTTTAIDALPYDIQFEVPREKLSIEYSQILGHGAFGVVHKGTIDALIVSPESGRKCSGVPISAAGQLEVAVKVCKMDLDVANFKALLIEIKVMAYLGSHEHIVNLVGASTANIRNRELYIAMEFCSNGSLKSYLRQRKKNFSQEQISTLEGLSPKMLLQWIQDMAEGLEYIHSKKIIHADLAIRNVLLTKTLSAKIGDFGLSRQLVDSASYTKTTKCPLPWRNMAVESLKNLEFSVKSDMWSFGVTLWELFTLGDLPYPGLNYTTEFPSLLETGLRLYKPPLASNAMYDYMLLCWTIEPADRPNSADVKVICTKEMTILDTTSYLNFL